MVPRLATAASRVMPMPLSRIVTVPALGSPSMVICRSGSWVRSAGSAIAAKRSRSLASDAFEMSSRRKISLWLYKEWIMSCSSSRTSAWKPWVCLSLLCGVCSMVVMLPFRFIRPVSEGSDDGNRIDFFNSYRFIWKKSPLALFRTTPSLPPPARAGQKGVAFAGWALCRFPCRPTWGPDGRDGLRAFRLEPQQPPDGGGGKGDDEGDGGMGFGGLFFGGGRRDVATCADQVVELIPQVQKDFHMRVTLPSARRSERAQYH